MKVKDLTEFLKNCNPESRIATRQVNGEVDSWIEYDIFIQLDPTVDIDSGAIPDVEIISIYRE